MTQKATKVRALTEGAIMIAAATVLGYLRIFRFPFGGSVDLALVPILVYCLRWGPKYSLLCCFVNGVLQYFLGGGIAISWQSMLLDYVVAYTLVFLCGFGAGGSSDLEVRSLATYLEKKTGGTFVIQNVTGANGWIKTERQPPPICAVRRKC